MKLFRNRTVIGICSIFVALVIVIVFYLSSHSSVMVVQAKEDIPAGTLISASMLTTVNVGHQNLPSGVFTKADDVINKYASVDISAQDDVTQTKVSSAAVLYNLADGQFLLSVPVKNFADALSGKLQAGDVVTAYFPPVSGGTLSSSSASQSSQCPPELQYIQVAAVTASNGSDTDAATVRKQASSGGTNNNLPASVTLVVNARQAQLLTAQENNSIYFALACHGGGQRAQQLLQQQANYFIESSTLSAASSQSSSSASKADAANSYSRVSLSNESSTVESNQSGYESSAPSIDWGIKNEP